MNDKDILLRCITAILIFVIAVAAFLGFTFTKPPISNNDILEVKDKPLLTPEQQRILVREGSVEAHGMIFENNKDIIPYLDEGGIR